MINITDSARTRIGDFVSRDVVREPALRIEAQENGGAAPAQRSYRISLVEREDKERTEIAVNVDGIRVLLNLDTSNLLSGATVDWVEADGDSGFRVEEKRKAPPPQPKSPVEDAEGADPLALTGPLAEKVQQVFDSRINPAIASHGGKVELVDVDEKEGNKIFLRMMGGCQGCAASAATLRMGIERMLKEAIPDVGEIVDVTDHTAGANPYF